MTRREFHFVEGKSSKFWAVAVSGTTMTVQFGKIGTAGQTQNKEFPTPEKARSEAEKLIAEKTRKGYKEVTSHAPAPSAAKPVPAPKPAPVAPSAPAPTGPPRRMELPASDLRRAAGPPDPLPPAAPRPLDLPRLKEQFIAASQYGDLFTPLPAAGPEEARFWLHAAGCIVDHGTWQEHFKAIRKITEAQLRRTPNLEQLKAAFELLRYWAEMSVPVMKLQAAWLPPADLVELFTANPIARMAAADAAGLADWLAVAVYPRLDAAAMAAVRERLRGLMAGKDGEAALVAAVLARHADMAADVEAYAARLKKGGIAPSKVAMGWSAALFAIADHARLAAEFRRLGLRLVTPDDARFWLARTGHGALDVLRDSILAQRKAADLLALLDVLLLPQSPEAAVALLEVKSAAKPPEVATRVDAWMKAHRDHAVTGLTPLAAESTPRGEAARTFLGAATPAADDGPNWLAAALSGVQPARGLPPFAVSAVLPRMGAEDVARVVAALQTSTLTGPHPLVAALRRRGDRPALAAFAWKLFEGWLAAGAPSKEKWAMLAVGHFGDDAAVLKLTPLIRAWPGESQHQRAVTGLEVLRAIGSDTALTALNGMALKLKFKGLQERARQMMDLIATDRGLTREQLEDRIVPDLGLDADGRRTFDFGPRRFRLVFTEDLSPALIDEAGKELKDLPKPGAKDDAAKAGEAAAEWKAFKAQLRATLKVQLARLEEAMVTGRAWTPDEFRTLLVRHPFLGHLVRRVLWQGDVPFRVTDEGAAVAHDRTPVALDGVAAVRVAHRLRMTPGQHGSWRTELDSLHIEPPFPQLERPVFAPQPGEELATAFARPAGPIPALTVRGTLEERGWRRHLHDHGGISCFSKPYVAAGVTAVVEIDPGILLSFSENDDQRITAVYFVTGINHRYGACADEEFYNVPRVPLGSVDAVAFSETLRDLTSLSARGK